MPSNMSQNDNNTIIVDGSKVNGNYNATFVLQQGGKQRPICTQYTNHTGAKAEMVATNESAKFKFVSGSTDPQSYMEIFEDKINFSKPIYIGNKLAVPTITASDEGAILRVVGGQAKWAKLTNAENVSL